MAEKKLIVEIKGALEDEEYIRFSELVNQLRAINDTLTQLDHRFTKSGKPSVYYRIVGVSLSSPTTFEIAATPLEPEIDYGNDVFDTFVSGWKQIQAGKIPEDFEAGLVENFRRIAPPPKGHIDVVVFKVADNRVEIHKGSGEKVGQLIEGDKEILGTVSGLLEELNVHGVKKFKIYPPVGPTSIQCVFPDKLKKKVYSAIEKNVTVKGKLKYEAGSKFPNIVLAEDIEIHKSDEQLPKLSDLRGIAPDATEGLPDDEW